MFGSAAIEVAIGLAFVYLLLSVVALHINEFIATIFSLRAKDLERGIRRLLAGDNTLLAGFWAHPLISSMLPKEGKRPSYIPSGPVALAIFDTLAKGNSGDLQAIRNAAAATDTPPARAVVAIIDSANNDLDRARAGVAAWYEGAMERISGIYKRKMQAITFAVAAVVTVGIGADSIAIGSALWSSQGVRGAVANAAAGATTDQTLEKAVDTLGSYELPIGWVDLPQTPYAWMRKALGLLLTTFAVSLGAPFWFDVLKRVTNLRGAGPAPDESGTDLSMKTAKGGFSRSPI